VSIHKYHDKFAYFSRLIHEEVHEQTDLIVVIPAYNEASLLPTLNSLAQCKFNGFHAEVIIVFNSSENDLPEVNAVNRRAHQEILQFKEEKNYKGMTIHAIDAYHLPQKWAGVGLARKIGMDEAALRFKDIKRDGVIVGFDADSFCEENYLHAIHDHFSKNPKCTGCSIYFEHPTDGDVFNQSVYQGIINYELHLRYYNQAFRFTGHPFAYHTVGSSFAVRTSAYCKQGGMNKRKAGEDFYFIQKIISLGNYSELNETKVIPSPRPSDRVPFGTGRAILKILEDNESFRSYSFDAFLCLKAFFQLIPEFYLNRDDPKLVQDLISEPLRIFIKDSFFEERLSEINANTNNFNSFSKRFFQWFNAFMVLKFVHFYRDRYQENQEVLISVNRLLSALQEEKVSVPIEGLIKLRWIEKKRSN